MTLKRIPAEGAVLKELRVYGNAKDCSVRMETTEPELTVYFEMRDPTFEIDLQGSVQSIIDGRSDVELGVKYLPLETLRVEQFVVDYPGSEHEWQKTLKGIREGSSDPFTWMLSSVRVKIVPVEGSEPARVKG